MGKRCILALDQGTTSSRAILYDHDGTVISQAQKEFPQHYPKPGWVEHNPMDIWSTQSATANEAISKAGADLKSIAAIGITNQRETTVVWNRKSGRPIHNAIVWQDRRTAALCQQLRDHGHESTFRDKTGLRLDPYFSGTKLRWILDHVDGARSLAKRGDLLFGTVDSWLLYNLTKQQTHATDATNACRTLLYNIHTGDWDDELLGILDIPRAMLPEVRDSSGIFADSILNAPVAGIAGDQHAALFGQACFTPGMAKNTYGTGSFLLMHTGTKAIPSDNNLLTTIAWQIDGQREYALEGSTFIAGAVVQWLRDELQIIRTASECDTLAASVPNANGAFLVPAFAGLGAPHWDPYARGILVGITRGLNRAHLCRAAIEAIAFQSADLAIAMEADSGIPISELRVDGGACKSDPLLQFQADLLQIPVQRPTHTETTASGAAALAGLAVNFWNDHNDFAKHWQLDHSFTPKQDKACITPLIQQWHKAVERAKLWHSPQDDA